jgi:methanogenic corrinoid protein MtbC1
MRLLRYSATHEDREATTKGKFALGVCEGDIHDIGKKYSEDMLDAAGYEIIDLGPSVP